MPCFHRGVIYIIPNKIAVLGVELMHRVEAGYRTVALSTYELNIQHDGIESSGWMDYVGTNNKCALEFVTLHPAGDGHVYILTAASWREFARTA